jgi:DNA-binding CsgD family transcriptional regulator
VPDSPQQKRRFTDDAVDRVLNAQSPEQIVKALSHTAQGLDFPYFTASYQSPTSDGEIMLFDNHPKEWVVERSVFSDEDVLSDPVLQHMSHSSLPMVWNQQTYTEAGKGHVWERCSQFGMRSGICMTIHGPQSQVLYIGFIHEQQKKHLSHSADVIGALYLSGAAVLEHSRAHFGVKKDQYSNALTVRELEVLKWCHAGKTAWEISVILSISEATVNFHIRNLVLKLDVTNKQQAVIRAIRYRLI